MKKKMAFTYTEDDVDTLNDIFSAMELCDANSIDFGDLESLGEFQKLLNDRLKSSGKDDRTKVFIKKGELSYL
jgi:hypothetical protein